MIIDISIFLSFNETNPGASVLPAEDEAVWNGPGHSHAQFIVAPLRAFSVAASRPRIACVFLSNAGTYRG